MEEKVKNKNLFLRLTIHQMHELAPEYTQHGNVRLRELVHLEHPRSRTPV